jgi:hypothetical protein
MSLYPRLYKELSSFILWGLVPFCVPRYLGFSFVVSGIEPGAFFIIIRPMVGAIEMRLLW